MGNLKYSNWIFEIDLVYFAKRQSPSSFIRLQKSKQLHDLYYCWKFWSWEMKYHHESGVESKSFHHKWRGEAESRVMKWFWFNDRRVMIFHFSTPEFSAISFQKFIHWRTIKYFTITISTYTTISGHLFGKY